MSSVDYENEIKALQERLLAKERELQRIYNSRGWIILQFLYRVRRFILPAGGLRERVARSFFRAAKKTTKYCIKVLPTLADIARQHIRKFHYKGFTSDKYDLIVFSVIEWKFRFQRPQQIARQFARAGHRVFYVSQKFTSAKTAVVRQIEDNIYELALAGDPDINAYKHSPPPNILNMTAESLQNICLDLECATAVLLVQLPFWASLAERMRAHFGWPIVYDCMDDHAGFSTNGEFKHTLEQRLLEQADLVVTSSSLLEQKARAWSSHVALIRNATDYEHFAGLADKRNGSRKVTIGYYGAIANWFDSDLAADLAELQPNWEFQLVGNTYAADVSRLKRIKNIKLLGERPYAELPGIIADWDACIIPFCKIPLTEATNPVKVYEMLAAGKPVVSVDLPEVRQIAEAGLIRIAHNARDFADNLQEMIDEQTPELIESRQAFARKNTWTNRYEEMSSAIISALPKVSIIVVMHNNLELNKLCLSSILDKTDYPNYEIILVDNASTDGSREFALELSHSNSYVQVILNSENESFAKANNRALDCCRGEYVVFLNNDTIVTRGWLTRFLRHLKNDPSIGMIGPVSNAVGNEAKIAVPYTSPEEINAFAEQYCRKHEGETFEIATLALFCAAIQRTVLEEIGRLDERYDVGMFEDDDLCMRIKRAGFRLVCAEDVFIHHYQQGTFKLLTPDYYKQVFDANRKKYEEKWGPWKPHQHRKRAS